MVGGCKLMNRFLCTSIAQDILNLIIRSTMSDVSFVKCMILCYIFLEALYMCVVYIIVGVSNEWDRPEPAEALMDMPKKISLLQSRREKGIVAVWGGHRLQSHFLSLSSAGVALELRILVLWGMNIKTRLTLSSGALTMLSVLSSAKLCQVRLPGTVDPFEPK